MRIHEVRYQNFGPFEDVMVDFSTSGLTVVEGEIVGVRGCDSNGCLVGDTLIDMPRDLQKYPKGVPIADLVGTRPWVYAWDGQKIVVRQAARVWRTKRAKTVTVRVTKYGTRKGSGNGGRFIPPLLLRGTPDHRVLLADGETWRAMGDLQKGDRICSMYRRWTSGSRALLRWTGMAQGVTVSEQQLVCEARHGARPEGAHAHHEDDDKYNNAWDNLNWVDAATHLSGHTAERNRRGEAGWKVSGKHPRGMAGKTHTEDTKTRMRANWRGGRPKMGHDKACEACGEDFYVSPSQGAQKFCSADCRYGRVNHAVVSVEASGAADVYDMEVPGVSNFVANGMVVHNSGKSFLLDGIAWALYGRCVRDRYKGDDVIRNGESTAQVTVWMEGATNMTVDRIRGKGGGVRLYVEDEDVSRGTNPETDVAIVETLGMDFQTFVSAVAFSGVASFFEATDKDRKGVLERFLGIDAYARAEKQARLRYREVVGALEVQDAASATAQSVVIACDAALEELREDDGEDVETEALRARVHERALKKRLVRQDQHVQMAEADVRSEVLTARTAQEAFKLEQREYEQAVASADKDLRLVERAIGEADAHLSRLSKVIAGFEELSGQPCPTCTQKVSTLVARDAIKALHVEVRQHEDKKATAQTARDSVSILRKSLQVPVAPAYPELERVKVRAQAMALELTRVQGRVREVKTLAEQLEARWEKFLGAREGLEAQRAEASAVVAKAGVEIAKLTATKRQVGFWVEGFGAKGVRSFLLESTFPQINKAATTYARQLFGGLDVVVRLTPTKKLKSKDATREELTVEATIPGYTKSYAGASKGQKRRLDLALLLAFRDLVASRALKPFDQLFADELFDGLDASGVDSVLAMLRTLSEDRPVILVTHDPRLKSGADQVLFVRHEDGKAEVVA